MAEKIAVADPKNMEKPQKEKKNTLFRQMARRLLKDRGATMGLIIIVAFILIAIFASVIAPYDPYELDITALNQRPSAKHIFGTDELGRDVFSRLVYGSRASLVLGVLGASFSLAVAIVLGCLAGYFGGIVETLIMRMCDVMMSIPGTLLSIIISAVLGNGFMNTVFALSVGGIPSKVRMLRGQILRERKEEYLEAAESYNCSKGKIMFKHLLPNVISPLLVSFTMGIGGTIKQAAGLSYLGLGIQPPTPEWGAMLTAGRDFLRSNPYLILFPGIIIMIFCWAVNLFGDGLRDVLDPKLKN